MFHRQLAIGCLREAATSYSRVRAWAAGIELAKVLWYDNAGRLRGWRRVGFHGDCGFVYCAEINEGMG
jgi:hypothetical protein